jgi:hypothetical protein
MKGGRAGNSPTTIYHMWKMVNNRWTICSTKSAKPNSFSMLGFLFAKIIFYKFGKSLTL